MNISLFTSGRFVWKYPVDDLAPIIEQIGSISDKTEAGRWQIAEAIYTAFEELPHHTQGLLQGLCQRLKYSTTQVYNYSHAHEMWKYINSFANAPALSVSHYARIYDLQIKYDVMYRECSEYLKMAAEESWSVRQLAQEVANNHDPDTDLKDRNYFVTTVKRMRRCWEFLHKYVDKDTRAVYYDLLKELEKI